MISLYMFNCTVGETEKVDLVSSLLAPPRGQNGNQAGDIDVFSVLPFEFFVIVSGYSSVGYNH